MRNKIFLLIILIGIILAYWFAHQDHENKVVVSQSRNEKNTEIENNAVNHKKHESLKKSRNIDYEKNRSLKVIDLFSQNQFSDDPFVEAVIVNKVSFDCGMLYKFSYNNSVSKFSSIQRKYITSFQQACTQHKQTYDNSQLLKSLENQDQVLMILSSESKYAELIHKGLSLKFMDEEYKKLFFKEFITAIMKSQNGYVIALLPDFFNEKEGRDYINELSDRFGIINHRYVKLIMTQAIQLFSCQFNSAQACSTNSYFMITQCAENELACGLDIESWFKKQHTAGHNRDIEQLLHFFNEQYR